jgi:hypothetical protein
MNIRLDKNTFRLRLNLEEGKQLLASGKYFEKLPLFYTHKLDFVLETTTSPNFSLNNSANEMRILIPVEDLQKLIVNPTQKGISTIIQKENINIIFQIDTKKCS